MDIKLILGLIWPFFKEAIFGRSIDPNKDANKEKSIHQKVIDFFMKSYRATSALIIFSIIAFFVSVISVKKIASIAITREQIPDAAEVVESKPQKHQKPDDSTDDVKSVESGDINVEDSRQEILTRIRNMKS